MQFESEEDKHIGKEEANTRTEPKGKPVAFKLQTSRMYWKDGQFCLFVSCFVLGWPEAGCDAKLENPNFKGFCFFFLRNSSPLTEV